MKKILFGLAAIALAVSSCSENEEISSELTSKKAINFTAYTQLATRGVETTTTNLTTFSAVGTRYGVETQVFYEATSYTYDTTNKYWASSPEYLWPNYNINFYAYNALTSGTKTHFKDSITIIKKDSNPKVPERVLRVNVSDSLATQTDLVAGTKFNAGPEAKTGINFNHILSRVSIEAMCSNSNYVVKVKQAKLANLDPMGTFTYATPNATDDKKEPKFTDNSCGTGYYAGVMKQVGDTKYKNGANSRDYLTTQVSTKTAVTLNGTAYQRVMFDGVASPTATTQHDWYLIPQEFTAWPTNAADATENPYYMTPVVSGSEKHASYIALLVSITTKPSGSATIGSKVYPTGGGDEETYAWMAVPFVVEDYQVLADETTGAALTSESTPKLADATNGIAQGKSYVLKLNFFSTNGGAGYSDPEEGEAPKGRPIITPDPNKKYIRFDATVTEWTPTTATVTYDL